MGRFIERGLFADREAVPLSARRRIFDIQQFGLGFGKTGFQDINFLTLQGEHIAQILNLPILMCHHGFEFVEPVLIHGSIYTGRTAPKPQKNPAVRQVLWIWPGELPTACKIAVDPLSQAV